MTFVASSSSRPSPHASDTTSPATSDEMTAHPEVANGTAGVATAQYSVEYLSQLLKDKKQLAAFPNVFHHLERLADEEISRVRVALFQFEFTKKDEVALPDADGEPQVVTEKVFVPAKEHPDYNFVGRILGPRGMTAKQLEQETGCKIMVRGRGSMRDKKKEEMNRGKPNWEHLSEELHVLIQCEDSPNRAKVKLARAVDEVRKLLVPAPEGEDELKKKQLMELAIINGTYRSATQQQHQELQLSAQLAAAAAASAKAASALPSAVALQAAAAAAQARGSLSSSLQLQSSFAQSQMRSPGLAGAPIILSPSRTGQTQAAAAAQAMALSQQSSQSNMLAAAQQAALLQQQQQEAYQQLLLGQSLSYETLQAMQMQQYAAAGAGMDYAGMLAAQAYPTTSDYSATEGTGGAMLQRRVLGAGRDHPYQK